jgi:hypothetical protein
MAMLFPNQVLRIRKLLAVAVSLWLACAVALASAAAVEQTTAESASTSTAAVLLKPYTAEYKTSARGMSLTLKRELKLGQDGSYTLINGGSIMILGFEEVAHFRTAGSRIIPGSYVYQGKGLMNRRREVQFTEGATTLRSLYKDEWYDLPYTDNTLDRMSQQEQVRLILLNDPTPKEDIVISVADKKRVKEYQISYVGEETLDTPLGKIDTLHFRRIHDSPDRKSDTWIAPAWDYMMVKTVHIEDGKPIEGMITKMTIDGREISSK